jgi:hypothetical protein
MNRIVAFAAALCAGIVLQAAAGEVYKWVDKNGTVHYGDRPPDDAGAHEVNTASLPLPLQERLRSLDPYFAITHFGGNLQVGLVCGEFDPESVGSNEPRFAQQVEATSLGTVKPDYSPESHAVVQPRSPHFNYYGGYTGASYPTSKCAWAPPRDARIQRRVYLIRFNPDAVRAYQMPGSPGGH